MAVSEFPPKWENDRSGVSGVRDIWRLIPPGLPGCTKQFQLPDMPPPVLSATSVSKRFATVTAVDRVSLSVAPGEILALLGPNGAGKTTFVRMIMGILEPDAGEVIWALDGAPDAPDRTRIGFLPEERGLYQDVPILRTLTY